MPFIPIPDTALVKIRALWDGQRVENTLYFTREVGSWNETLLTALAAAIGTWWVDNMLPALAASYIVNSIVVQDLNAEAGAIVEDFAHSGTPGEDGTGSMPNNVSWVVKFVTGLSGRSFRGRNYIPGLTRGTVTGDYVALSFADGIKSIYEMLLDSFFADTAWTVVSRQENLTPRTVGVATKVTSVGYTDLVVDSRRRRLPGRGE